MNEYAHAMGNSLGDFNDYWKLIYENDMLAGGFVWDWVDQAMWKNRHDPAEGFLYGGDFGDSPMDKNFCINRIAGADRVPHPHYYELKKVYQPVSFKLIGKDPFSVEIITNRQLATNLSQFDFHYILHQEGQQVSEGSLTPVEMTPLSSQKIALSNITWDSTKECFITIQFLIKDDKLWAKRGDVFAWEQFQLSNPPEVEDTTADQGFLIPELTDNK